MSKLTSNELSDSLNNLINEKQDKEDYSLMTENKTIVGAINEIYGKELIANAIGEPLKATDTFTNMSNDINGLLSIFKTNMMNSGVTVESNDKFKSLIDKIKGLTEGEGNKGIKFASKIYESADFQENVKSLRVETDLDFTPTYIFCKVYAYFFYSFQKDSYSVILSDSQGFSSPSYTLSIENITSSGFDITATNKDTYGGVTILVQEWYAIGVASSDGTQVAEGTITDALQASGSTVSKTITLDFKPTSLYITGVAGCSYGVIQNAMVYLDITNTQNNAVTWRGIDFMSVWIDEITDNSFTLNMHGPSGYWYSLGGINWVAIKQ